MKIDSKYLHQHIPIIDFNRPILNFQIAQLLTKFMQEKRAIGLAANQVGYKKRVFVMNTDSKIRHCFNPEILNKSEYIAESIEGCLSYPKDWIKVARPEEIHVKYYDYQGNFVEEKLTGISARCFQHELDHLNGITMHNRHKEQNYVLPKS